MARTPEAELAILLASSASEVRDFLKKRASSPSFFDPISMEAEAKLLGKAERLIDLSLAEYCLHRETAWELFARDPNDGAVRTLVLSNQALGKTQIISHFPECLFGSEEALLAYLGTISPSERSVLFTNPTLDENFLEAFLSMGAPWQEMIPEQRLWALNNLAANPKLQKSRSVRTFDEGWDWYMAGKPFEAAWLLIEKLEPTEQVARHLSVLLRDLPADCSSTTGIADRLSAWQAVGDAAVHEEEQNAKGRLSHFQDIRQAGARLLANAHKAEPSQFLNSDDIALRCGSYESMPSLEGWPVDEAVQRDGDLARVHLVRNERLWRSEKSRDKLRDIMIGSDGDEPRWEFQRRERHYRKEHSAWFKGDGFAEPDDGPVSENTIGELVADVTSDPAVKGLQERLTSLEGRQRTLIWMGTLILAALALLLWR